MIPCCAANQDVRSCCAIKLEAVGVSLKKRVTPDICAVAIGVAVLNPNAAVCIPKIKTVVGVVPSPIALRKSLRVHDVFIFKPLTE